MEDDTWYPCQSILVHELAHAVLNLALASEVRQDLISCYERGKEMGTYPRDSYLLTNEQEFFAVLTESWFSSTLRDDLNGGVRSREDVKGRDPGVAKIMQRDWGDGSWRFTDDCPCPLTIKRKVKASPRPPPPSIEPSPVTSPSPIRPTMERDSTARDDSFGTLGSKRKLSESVGNEEEGLFSRPRVSLMSSDLCFSSCFPTSLLSLQLGLAGETQGPREDKTR